MGQSGRVRARTLSAGWVLLLAATAKAEGTAQLGTSQALRGGTTVGVDIIDSTSEAIRWTGNGSVAAYGPDSRRLGTFASGAVIAATSGNGAYQLVINRDQATGAAWDVEVTGQKTPGGRLWAKNWQFNAGSFAQNASTNASFYALVPAGDAGSQSVIELQLNGLAGYIYDINANRRGVNGPNAGRSVPEAGNSVSPEYSIYLRVPSLANFQQASPSVSDLTYAGGVSKSVLGDDITPCDQVLPGKSQGFFSFNATTEGSYQLQCDLNRDGVFSIGDGLDLLLLGPTGVGTNVVAWDGMHAGAPIATGTYECRVKVTVGEFHYVGRDIETSYPGMRIFRVNANETRTGLPMYWNDHLVQANDARMPNGAFGLVSSEGLVAPGARDGAAVPNQNARSWGNFTGAGKGNVAFLDTYVWLDEATSASVQVRAADLGDSDGDGLTDFQESCLVGSEPTNADTDGDSVPDGAQYAIPVSSAFSGLESNGRLASALARRAIRRTRMSVAPSDIGSSGLALEGIDSPARWMPDEVEGAFGVSDTPTDLLDVTNAVAVTGSDYVTASGRRRGGALILTARGGFYEHQKSICDRVRGASLIDVRPSRFRTLDVLTSVLASPREGRLEHALSLHLWDDAGTLRPAAFWVGEQAPVVSAGATVLTLQTWGDSPEFVMALAEAIVGRIESEQAVAWPRDAVLVDDEDYVAPPSSDAPSVEAPGAPLVPSVLIDQVTTLGGYLELSLRRMSGSGPVQLEFSRLEQDAVTRTRETVTLDAGPAPTRHGFDFAPFLEATVDVVDRETVVDRVWASDGAWAAYDESVWQGGVALGTFTRECPTRDLLDSDRASAWQLSSRELVRLSGCGKVERDTAARGGVARALITPLDATQANTLAYWIAVDRPYKACLENADASSCVTLPARRAGGWEAVPLTAFGEVAASTEVVTFATDKASSGMEVSGLTLLAGGRAVDTRPSTGTGCSVTAPSLGTRAGDTWFAALALALAARLHRRARSNQRAPRSDP